MYTTTIIEKLPQASKKTNKKSEQEIMTVSEQEIMQTLEDHLMDVASDPERVESVTVAKIGKFLTEIHGREALKTHCDVVKSRITEWKAEVVAESSGVLGGGGGSSSSSSATGNKSSPKSSPKAVAASSSPKAKAKASAKASASSSSGSKKRGRDDDEGESPKNAGENSAKKKKEDYAKGGTKERQKDIFTKAHFLRKAKGFKLDLPDGAGHIKMEPKEFSTGSMGFCGFGKKTIKVDGKDVVVQANVNWAIIGSKEWADH